MATIVVNSVIEWIVKDCEKTLLERVLWIDNCRENAVTISLTDRSALPVWRTIDELENSLRQGEAIKRTIDPFLNSIREEDIKSRDREKRDKAWKVIEQLVKAEPDIYIKEKRGLVTLVATEFGVPKRDVYTWLRRFWMGGKVKNALLPHYHRCGAPGKDREITTSGKKLGRPRKATQINHEHKGINIDDDLKQIFRVSIQLYYDSKKKRPLTLAYEEMIRNHFVKGSRIVNGVVSGAIPPISELPSLGQFKYWFAKERDLKKSLIAREGERGFNLRHRAILGDSTSMSFGPGSIYQIDATIADVYLVSRYESMPIIGRPVIYTVIDVFSRMIVGLYVGLEGPSWIGAMMALANAASDKVAYCEQYGIDISEEEWPCHYLPERILADRGEMISSHADYLSNALDITITNTPPYRADFKGIVEQSFRLSNLRSIRWLPGAVTERFRERGEKDHRLDATLDLHQFTKVMINTVLYHNNSHFIRWYSRDEFMIADQVERVPTHLWNWGIHKRSGHLREISPDKLKLNLMPRDEGVVTERGLRFKGMHYSCERALREQWFERARASGNWKVPISYDPRNVDVIYYRSSDQLLVEPCELLERESRYKGKQLEEVRDLLELEKIEASVFETKELQAKVDYLSFNEAIIAEALEMKKNSSPKTISDKERVKNIKENHRKEKAKRREDDKWDLRPLNDSEMLTNTQSVIEIPMLSQENDIEKELVGGKTKHRTMLEMLKSQRKEGS
ncbi:hypothetical protein EDM59_21145 [Brevibacillus nitrificans]|uniref:Integrase catalytic domain-containing protein n=1 Tax=Brevibacillus nitrificans TaxID=651560 RepID=A0A3M8D3T6_9BACL|nr:Mu transposase C-terminal domain-containing protein [Brevibacillus nitrificans]RNB82117.1 hypothetical protein EDM59_21145 [Brevibacillus nitrificans]